MDPLSTNTSVEGSLLSSRQWLHVIGVPLWRKLAVFGVAASDSLSTVFELLLPLEILLDIITALALWILLGWRWILLPAMVSEAIPGLAIFPTWLMVAGVYVGFPATRKQT